MIRWAASLVALLTIGSGAVAAEPPRASADLHPTMGGEMVYMADAARFTDCLTGQSFPIAMEGDYLALERAYGAAASPPGSPLYVTFDGAILPRPKMEGDGTERTVVVDRFINVWPGQNCERARADASLSNTWWRLVRLGSEPVQVADGRREAHLVLRDADGTRSWSASAGCNSLAGGYTVDGDSIRIDPGATTLMACPPALDALEREFGRALQSARRWQVTASQLELFDEKGAPLALFEATYF